MEVKETNFKRFIASEGMALKWKQECYNYHDKKPEEGFMWSAYDAIIDMNNLIGEVEEIPYSQYEEETKSCAFNRGCF